jgi:hypothetical protein
VKVSSSSSYMGNRRNHSDTKENPESSIEVHSLVSDESRTDDDCMREDAYRLNYNRNSKVHCSISFE